MNTHNTDDNAAREAGQQLPNYRIYDRTGGGVRQDIYAADLDTAIEMGRAWIENGDWSERGNPPGTKIELPCDIREIVYVPDLRSIEALPGVYEATLIDWMMTLEIDTNSREELLSGPLKGIVEMFDAALPKPDGAQFIHCRFLTQHRMMIDNCETDHGQSWDCTGTFVEP